MREDIYYRGQYAPTSAGEYRVHVNEFNVWTADRSEIDRYGKLKWCAVDHDSPAYEAAVSAHKLVGQSMQNKGGYFLTEQLCQFAATLAGQKAEQGVAPAACAALAAARITQLSQLPLQHAIVNLQRAGLIPDTVNAMQSQLIASACKQADDPHLISWMLHSRQHDSFDFTFLESLERHGNIAKHLDLASPQLINLMRQNLINHTATAELHDNLAEALWHFPEGTPITQAHTWLDQAASWPIEAPADIGAVRVIRDWSNMDLSAERMVADDAGGHWELIDPEHSTSKAAVAAYNWAQDHCPLEGDLRIEGFRQRAANFAAAAHYAPMQAAQQGIQLAKEQATRFFNCSRDLAYPQPSSDDEGVRYQLLQMSSHYLTQNGIASHLDLLQGNTNSRPDSLVAVKPKDSGGLAIGVSMCDSSIRMNLHCDPKIYLRVGNPTEAFGPVTAQELKDDLSKMATAAGLGDYSFTAVESLSVAEPEPNQYKVQLITSKFEYGQDLDTTPDGDESLHEDVYENTELKRLFREKGLSETPTVAQFGDGSWEVTWRSDSSQENREFFEQGIETQYALKLISANGDAVTPEIAQVFASEVGVTFSNPYAQTMAQALSLKFG
jgi:hypothetical protein